ncbi:hypothetical protein WMW72_24505 [Paenibacillus filicis]|uniref:Transposase n=1 Tax=Paenibacillus filicis TaxID=669464 RepID=A0ABU9DQU0_9BACL
MKHVAIEPDSEQVIVDTTIVRVHQHGADAKWGRTGKPSDVRDRWLTTKIHAMVDALDYPLL